MYVVRLVQNATKVLRSYGIRGFVAKTKSFVRGKMMASDESYDENVAFRSWLCEYEKVKNDQKSVQRAIMSLKKKPKVSIIIPVYNPERSLFEVAIRSIQNQYYDNWELCMCDDASKEPWVRPYLQNLAKADPRIKVSFAKVNGHIAVNSNRTVKLSTGPYLLFMDDEDMLPPWALLEYAMAIENNPHADIIYGDEYKVDMDGVPMEPWFRTDYGRELEYAMCPFTHCVISRRAFEKAGRFKKGTEGSQDYDLYLRIAEQSDAVVHIPEMLYAWRKAPGSTAESIEGKPYAARAAKAAIQAAAKRRGLKGVVEGETYPFRFRPRIVDDPSVEIIILTKNQAKYLKSAIASVRKKAGYSNYSITVVDHECDDKATIRYLDKEKASGGIKVVPYRGAYNFSRMNNLVAQKSSADILVFMNNDIVAVLDGWLNELVSWAQRPDIGPVGTLLIYPDGRVQHAGVVLGVGGIANHAYWLEPESTTRYFNHIRLARNYSAVTAALMAVSRRKFLELGGFNEKELAVAYQDIDLCLRMWERGYRTVYTPWAKAVHYESLSRRRYPQCNQSFRQEETYMIQRWKDVIEHDPFYNSNFIRGNMSAGQKTYRIGRYEDKVE